MRAWIQIVLVAVFVTASYRLVLYDIGDTSRGLLLAVLIFATSGQAAGRFFVKAMPLFMMVAIAVALDFIFGRTGNYLWVMMAQVVSGLLVASTVFQMSIGSLKKVIFVSIGLLFVNYAIITFVPGYFIATASDLGVVDPFVTYGRELQRMYYSYYNANAAAYAVYYMLLAFIALNWVSPLPKRQSWVVMGLLLGLILLTGGRGVILVIAALVFAWLLALRSSRSAMVVAGLGFGSLMVLPAFNAVNELVLLREESNVVRLDALNQYVQFIANNPYFGVGIEALRERVDVFGLKPSHNFFIEILAMFGFVLGGPLLAYLAYRLVIRPLSFQLKLLGFFSLMPGVFNNTLLTNWGFIPLAVPVLMVCAGKMRARLEEDSAAEHHEPSPADQPPPQSALPPPLRPAFASSPGYSPIR